MSVAIHVFMAERFSKESYRRFLDDVQKLFGKWSIVESTPFHDAGGRIHECRIKSGDLPADEWVSVWIDADRPLADTPMWSFDYEWHLSFETGTGRTPLGLAVQLGAVLLAMQSFQFILVVDRDTCVENEPTEFRSIEAVAEHIKRVLENDFEGCAADLQKRGIVSTEGYLSLPPLEG